MLSPFRFLDERLVNGLRLPFASARFGTRPENNNPNAWNLRDTGPLSANRDMAELAASMYRAPSGP
eukprot:4548107-Pleurochrysis_carterae.AAC.1